VISVASLPVIVSRLGWRFAIQIRDSKPWAAAQNRVDPWNLAGWVKPCLPRSRIEDYPARPQILRIALQVAAPHPD